MARRNRFAALLPLLFTLAAPLGAQEVPTVTRPEGARPVSNMGDLVVRIRAYYGGSISGPALVRLYSLTTGYQQTSGLEEVGQVTFRNVPGGEYTAEVSAPGFQRATEDRITVLAGMTAHVFIELLPDAATSGPAYLPGPPVLAPKARKETQKAAEALRKNELKEAQECLQRAVKLAPAHPDVQYLLGVLHLRLIDPDTARTHLEKATQIYPQHAPAQRALGALLLEKGESAKAIAALERALETESNSWEAHWNLANAYRRERNFEKAASHARQALKLSQGRAPEIQLLLAQALVGLRQRQEAVQEIQDFLAKNPKHPAAAGAQRMLEQLNRAAAGQAAGDVMEQALVGLPAASRIEASLPPPRWAPPSVDEVVPGVDPDVSCSLPDVLAATSKRILQLVDNMERFGATEIVEHAELNAFGDTRFLTARTFDYVVSITTVRPGYLAVEENRKPRDSHAVFPAPLVSRGLVALALLFHPYYVEDFEMRCEGLGRSRGQAAWQVYFRQRSDKPSRVRVYQTREGSFPVAIKGRAWIAANTYEVLRLESEVVAPMPLLGLNHERLNIEYTPVTFAQRKVALWLPASADLYAYFRGRRYHHRHSFSDYVLFSVDLKQQIRQPTDSVPPEPDRKNPPDR